MNIAFYIDEMNFRGVANSSYNYALYNQLILKNKSKRSLVCIQCNKENLDKCNYCGKIYQEIKMERN